MFDRLLTGPVVREEGVRRRGRRPKSEIAKAAAAQASLAAASSASTSGVNPFLLNGLFGGMDLSSLQNLQNLQLLMGLSPSLGAGAADNKNAATMLPLMLPAMGALPNVFGLGGLFGGNMAAAANLNTNTTATSESEDTKKDGDLKEEGEEKKEEAEKPAEPESSDANVAAAAATSLSTNPLAFNPFLLSTMAPGLFYPSMFLAPGLGGLGLPGFSPAALTELQNAMSGALGAAVEEKEANKETGLDQGAEKPSSTLENSDSEEGENKMEDQTGMAEEMDSMEAGEEEEDEEVGDDDEDKSD